MTGFAFTGIRDGIFHAICSVMNWVLKIALLVPLLNFSSLTNSAFADPQTPSSYTTIAGVPDAGFQEIQNLIVSFVNQVRTARGFSELTLNDKLVQSAQTHSALMARENVTSDDIQNDKIDAHQLPNEAAPPARMISTNACPPNGCKDYGENFAMKDYSNSGQNPNPMFLISQDFSSDNALAQLAGQLMTNLMNSPEHRANILKPNLNEIGIGVYLSSNGILYLTQDFTERR